MIEISEVPSLRHVYNARSLMPAKFSDNKVTVLKAENRSQVITKRTELGVLHEAEVIDEAIKDTQETKQENELSPPEAVAIEKMIKQLPDEVTEEQLKKLKTLLKEYRGIISTGEHDIGRTNLVEHRIDTGGHRPIRQALRRHPFQHLEFIDKEVKEMERHGIVELAASPWASNVVLVKKKTGQFVFVSTTECLTRLRTRTVTHCLSSTTV